MAVDKEEMKSEILRANIYLEEYCQRGPCIMIQLSDANLAVNYDKERLVSNFIIGLNIVMIVTTYNCEKV